MRIAILVPVRYPTEKAYGVNISNTAKALRELSHEVAVYCDTELRTDELGNGIVKETPYLVKLSKFLISRKKSLISVPGFMLMQLAFSVRYLRKLSEPLPDLIYTRWPILAYYFQFKLKESVVVVCDLHHKPNKVESKLLKRLNPNFVKLTVTNENFRDTLISMGLNKPIHILHNAATPAYFELESPSSRPREKLVIGYAGKAFSSGNSNGLDILLKVTESKLDFGSVCKFSLIGCEKAFYLSVEDSLKRINSQVDIRMRAHVSQHNLPKLVSEFDLALIPYPENDYYEMSSPLKILEMAAAGIPMIASNTKAHKRILGQEYPFYYEAGNVEDLFSAIAKASSSPLILQAISGELRALAAQFTYQIRAERIIQISSQLC